MPSPRPSGSGVEKILVSPHEVPQDHILDFVILSHRPLEPGVGLFASRLRLFFFLCRSSPSLSLALFRAPLSFPSGCPTIPSEVSHFVTVITLHLRGVPVFFPLGAMISISQGEGRLLVLLISGRRLVISQCKSSLRPRSCRRVHRFCSGYGWTRRRKEPSQVVGLGGPGPKLL